MIENLEIKQREIIERAAGLVKPGRREDFRKHVFDQLRAKVPPYANTTISQHLCHELEFIYQPPLQVKSPAATAFCA